MLPLLLQRPANRPTGRYGEEEETRRNRRGNGRWCGKKNNLIQFYGKPVYAEALIIRADLLPGCPGLLAAAVPPVFAACVFGALWALWAARRRRRRGGEKVVRLRSSTKIQKKIPFLKKQQRPPSKLSPSAHIPPCGGGGEEVEEEEEGRAMPWHTWPPAFIESGSISSTEQKWCRSNWDRTRPTEAAAAAATTTAAAAVHEAASICCSAWWEKKIHPLCFLIRTLLSGHYFVPVRAPDPSPAARRPRRRPQRRRGALSPEAAAALAALAAANGLPPPSPPPPPRRRRRRPRGRPNEGGGKKQKRYSPPRGRQQVGY